VWNKQSLTVLQHWQSGKFIGESSCEYLIGLHAFTGCDTVSAITNRGKLGAFKLMKRDGKYQETFRQLGNSCEVSKDLFDKIQLFTCHMYATTTTITEVNELRYQLLCAKRGEIESSQLPPCRDCLRMHVLRVNYQASIGKCCLQPQPIVPSPKECGWTIDEDGQLIIEWMRTPSAPDVILELFCKCLRSCQPESCMCLANGLASTNMCKLKTCSNQKKDEQFTVEIGDSDDEERDDD